MDLLETLFESEENESAREVNVKHVVDRFQPSTTLILIEEGKSIASKLVK